jgi:DUF1680 family protein
LLLNEDPVEASAEPGYLVVRRRWRPGDVLRYQLDMSPRLTVPDRRVDAVRGCAAIERGPLVYCLEQADQPAGTDLENLTLIPGELRDAAASLPGIGDTVLIETGAELLPAPGDAGLPYHSAPRGVTSRGEIASDQVTAIAIPYFQWDNRDGRPMLVWIPTSNDNNSSRPLNEEGQER